MPQGLLANHPSRPPAVTLDAAEQVIQRMKFFVSYFEHFVEQEPLFWPELERAEKILGIVATGGAGLAERVRSCLSAPMPPHYDGSGWEGFKSAVSAWLELQ